MRLIDADALIKETIEEKRFVFQCNEILEGVAVKTVYKDFIDVVNKQPTITLDDIRPKGEWIMHDDEILGLSCECSVCHIETMGDTPFCSHCGADMRGE